MDEFYKEISHYLSKGTYDKQTNTESRKATIRRASKSYIIKDEHLYYSYQGKLRLVVFQSQVYDILRSCHDAPGSGGHPGIRGTINKVLASYHWKTLRDDVKKWVDECPRCQRDEKIKTVPSVLHSIQVQEAWSVLGMDLIGPLPTTVKGKRYIMTATDLFTKWVVAKSLYTKTATEVSKKIANILFAFGVVDRIITDQGQEFVNEANRGVFEALGVKQCITSAYHPQANGQNECTNRNIKTALAKNCGDDSNDWDIHLRGIVAGINNSNQRSTKYTPYFALFGRHPRTPGVINIPHEEKDEKCVVVTDTKEHLEAKTAQVADLDVKVEFGKANRCILELPAFVLSEILKEVVLLEGDQAYLTLALVCTTFRDTVSTTSFRRQAHLQWLNSVATWSRFSALYKKQFTNMYSIKTCCECGRPYKSSAPGYVGRGKRGVLVAIYSEDPHPGYCSPFCSQMQ